MTAEPENSQNPVISVLMAVYNGERFLDESIRSILDQTYRDFEFLIVDDGSTDGSAGIIESFAASDNRIVPLRNETNLGLTRSLNIGIAKARGRFLARQDADDISLPDRFEKQLEFLENNPELGLIGTSYCVIDSNGRIVAERRMGRIHENLAADLIIKNHALLHTSVMARTSVIRQAGGYDESIRYAQDYELWLRLAGITRIGNCPEKLLKWRESSERISDKSRNAQLQSMFDSAYANLRQNPETRGLDKECFARLWWAYNGVNLSELTRREIMLLEPLWCYMSTQAGRPHSTIEGMKSLVYNLLKAGQYRTASELASVLRKYFNASVSIKAAAKNLVSSMLHR